MAEERAFSWDDRVENDGSEFSLLPAGDYVFIVASYERKYHDATDKTPECPEAVVLMNVKADDGSQATIRDNFLLHSRFEWKSASFFRSIGLKKHDEKMNISLKDAFDKSIGMEGKFKLIQRTYNEKQYNNIDKYYDKVEQKSYNPGVF